MRYAPCPLPYKYEKTRLNRAVALFVEFSNDGYNFISQTKMTLPHKLKDKQHKHLPLILLLPHAASLTI